LVLGALTSALAASDRIAFADLGGIQDFRPDGDEGIYIEGRNRQWYYARFFNPCYELKFNESVGFVVEPTGDLDRFSSILVGGEQCYFKSFDQVDRPE
jgi:hypothetical protein